MIKEIKFNQYKKLKNISIYFEAGLNAISGENGTCKSSLLYLVSNSFQAVTPKCEWVKEPSSLKIIRTVNSVTNAKVESLQRGDQKYSDPAHGVEGTLYTVSYYDHPSLDFRRHNSRSKDKGRYALKPTYKRGGNDRLPFCPVIYLGLSRLIPYGEFGNDAAVSSVKSSLTDEFKTGIAENFKKFTGYEINQQSIQQLGDIKKRSEFVSTSEGVDSNTVSAGEDNLYIILTALESLKNYYNCIESKNDIESILLIDEMDATLHPDYQIKLLDLMRRYSQNYKIQIIFTTHSLTAIEDLLDHHDRVTYLVDNVDSVAVMEDATIQQIKAHLYNQTEDDIYQDKCIPIFTEDAEARFLIKYLFAYYEDTKPEFRNVRRFFAIPEINISAEILNGLFKDAKLIKSHVGAFCVLDGDKQKDLNNCIIALPGKNPNAPSVGLSPERLLFTYAKYLADSDDDFWTNREVLNKGFSKRYYQDKIASKIEEFQESVDNKANSKKPREFSKQLFNKYPLFFEYIFKRWLHDSDNQAIIDQFYNDLKIMFKKCAEIRGINSLEWK